MMGTMEENIKGRTEADLQGGQAGEQNLLPTGETGETSMQLEGQTAGQKQMPSGDADEQTMMDAFANNTGQAQPDMGVDARRYREAPKQESSR